MRFVTDMLGLNMFRVDRVVAHPIPQNRSRCSLETSPGPESVAARFGDGSRPGLIIDHIPPKIPPLFRPSKNLPACLRSIKGSQIRAMSYPLTTRPTVALSGANWSARACGKPKYPVPKTVGKGGSAEEENVGLFYSAA